MQELRQFRSAVLVWTFALMLVAFLEFYRSRPPAILITSENRQVLVHIRRATQIRRILITDRTSGATVIELYGANGTPCLYFFSLREGINPITDINNSANCAIYQAVNPAGVQSFSLEQGHTYILSMWGRGIWRRRADANFEFQDAR